MLLTLSSSSYSLSSQHLLYLSSLEYFIIFASLPSIYNESHKCCFKMVYFPSFLHTLMTFFSQVMWLPTHPLFFPFPLYRGAEEEAGIMKVRLARSGLTLPREHSEILEKRWEMTARILSAKRDAVKIFYLKT